MLAIDLNRICRQFKLSLADFNLMGALRIVEEIHSVIARESHFVREVSRLSEEDRVALGRIMGELHSQLDRHFLNTHR
jgi:hypothetical protein